MKKLLKKTLSIILTLTLIMSLFSNIRVFATGSIEVGIKSNVTTVLPNGDVKLTVDTKKHTDVTGGIVGFNLQISYDSTKFTYKEESITLSTQHSDYDLAANAVPGTGMGVLTILGYDRLAVNQPLQEGDLFYVIFTAKSDFSGNADFEIAGSNETDNVADDSLLIENSSVAASFPSPNNKVTISLTETVKTATSITLKTEPTKKLYLQGEPLDLTGGLITVSYDDGSSIDVPLSPNAVLATGFDNTIISKQVITLSYTGISKVVTYSVSVLDPKKYVKVDLASNLSNVNVAEDVVITANANNFVHIVDGIVAFTFVVKYDNTKFDFKASSETLLQGILGDGILSVENDSVIGEVNVLYLDEYVDSVAHPLIAGDLFSLTFTAKTASGAGNFEIADLTVGSNIADNAFDYPTWEAISVIETPTNMVSVNINNAAGFVVTFDSQEGSLVDSTPADNNTTIEAPTAPTRTGYTFGGWYKEASCTTAWNFATDKVTSSITLFAKWTIENYTITFNSQSGSSVSNKTADYNTTITAPTAPTRTGYTFGGWYKEESCTTAWNFATDKVTSSITLFAKWTIENYTITFNSQSGSSVSNKTANYNTTITAPTAPTRAGHSFGGWYKEASCLNVFNFATDKITSSITLFAKWSIVNYTITFNSQSGSSVSNKTADYNTTITAPTAPTRTGYTFGGWYIESSCTTAWNFATDKITSTITLFAKWTINSYTVTFNSMSGSAVASKTATYNNFVAAPANPTRTGFAFLGWYTSSAYTTQWIFTTNKVTANTTLYARWIATTATGIKAATAGYNSIKLTWTAVSGATNYEIYRSTSATGTYALVVAITPTTPAYTNINLSFNTTYYYKVRGYALVGTVKTYSGYTAIASAKTTLATPTGLVATAATYNSTRLNWTAVSGANGYSVYRATSLTGTYSLLATVTTNTYTKTLLTLGTTYYYKVSAYRLVGTTKVYGAQCAAVGKRVVPPTITTFTAVRASATSIKLTWGAISGASGYELYRSTSLTGTYALVKAQPLLTYTNTALKTGTTYYYKVRAYKMVGTTKVYGDFSAVKSMKP